MASSLEIKIEEINKKLCQMLTKNDKNFIKDILISTLEEMKDKIMGSVIKRVEILEGEIHDKAVKNDEMKKEVKKCKEENEKLTSENKKLKENIQTESDTRKKHINELEQYGRKNNIRISGIGHDNMYETSYDTAEGIANMLRNKLMVEVSALDIDIAHRLGKYEEGKVRPVIVKFVQRQMKHNIMKNTRHLKNTNISINDDLTNLNYKVLSSLRLKDKANITKAWSFDGKLYKKSKDGKTAVVTYEEYAAWLDIPFPKPKI